MHIKPTIYLDYNATAPIKVMVRDKMVSVLDQIGNASSVHGFGRSVRKDIENARDQVADLVKTDPVNVTFTSGATEANNTVLFGTSAQRILVSAIEHPSIIDVVKKMNHAEIIPVTKEGVIDLQALEKKLHQSDAPTLISVMTVNNETGVIQPISEIVELAKAHGKAHVHSDAVQAAGRIDIDMGTMGVDYLSLSAHKIGGPMGVGALIYNHEKSHQLRSLIKGGGQERGRRAGTENAVAIAGFGEAAQFANLDLRKFQAMKKWRELAEQKISEAVPKAIIFGKDSPRVANTIQISLPTIPAATQLMALDLAGIAVSSGSACSSGSIKPSHVLKAMGASEDEAQGALRCSFGWQSRQSDLDEFVDAWIAMARQHGF